MREYLESPEVLRFWQDAYKLLFFISIPLTLFIAYQFFKMIRELEAKKKALSRDLHSPGMEDVRFLFKKSAEKLDIEIDDKHHENN